jgi:hypothetical protein
MPEHTIQADRVDELIRWHMPRTPVRPSCRLHVATPSAQGHALVGMAEPPTPDGGPGWAVPAALDAMAIAER